MSYLSLMHRVPEATGVEPRALTWLYDLISQTPMVRSTYRHTIAGVLSQRVSRGHGLDLGTGPGYVTLEIAARRPELQMVGLDLAAHMVSRARRQGGRTGLNGRIAWPQGDGHALPFADDSFDLVVSSLALHHWDDPLRVLDEIARVLKPDGRYYIADLCRQPNLIQRLFAYASIPAVSLPFGSYWGYGGYYESVRASYTRHEAQNLLERSALPPGEVGLDSTWLIPILTIASKAAD
jgi:ubiquinone/menaquinone biosynthesis C-methylase UbiE